MKKILVLGGGGYQVPLIERIRKMGYVALCIDRNPDSPGFEYASETAVIDLVDQEACLAYAQQHVIDAVMTYGATLPLPTVSYIGEHLHLPALPIETAEVSKNKFSIKQKLKAGGCNTFGVFFKMRSVEEALAHNYVFPCVIKPCDGSGSIGVSVVNNKNELTKAIRYAKDSARYGEFYCEQYITGKEYSVEAFVDRANVHVYGIIKTTFEKRGTDNESIEYGHRTPSGLDESAEAVIVEEIRKAVKALNVTMGSINFDVIVSNADGKPYIIDCGIRIGQNLIASHLIPISRGVDLLGNTIRQALGESFDPNPTCRRCIATRLLIYNPGMICEIGPVDAEIGKNGIVDIVLRKKNGDIQRPYQNKSDTCGWVLCSGDTPDEAERKASNARKALRRYFIIEKGDQYV